VVVREEKMGSEADGHEGEALSDTLVSCSHHALTAPAAAQADHVVDDVSTAVDRILKLEGLSPV
jgi:hypothetical protein